MTLGADMAGGDLWVISYTGSALALGVQMGQLVGHSRRWTGCGDGRKGQNNPAEGAINIYNGVVRPETISIQGSDGKCSFMRCAVGSELQ